MGSDAARTRQFYAVLFGWTLDLHFPDYAVVDTGTDRGIIGGLGGETGIPLGDRLRSGGRRGRDPQPRRKPADRASPIQECPR